ncbi:hypothetical protein K431DRAFT_234422 [Polychaeton citri CBS 116435]|uniref:Uncharacterized protein n=1 Tax=Polychaeton citri CBS 116435 TaxID=1314669 RepID=A0A9P4PZC9_9PEZI|nr:hypothetical protein K431DRAFT_234422 [Polychaeton citri CBS 116435]
MAASLHLEPPHQVAEKVLRRAHVSRMTRVLQDRLALANVKIQNGWENMSIDTLEPQIEERMRMRRKRPASSTDTTSDTASTVSSRMPSSSGLGSSPLTAPMYSDDQPKSGGSRGVKRTRTSNMPRMPTSAAVNGRRTRVARGPPSSWKKSYSLPESSPIKSAKHTRFSSFNHVSQLSFISEGSTVPDDPPSPEFSEDDDSDLPVQSFNAQPATRTISSPPRTPPPPGDRRMRKTNNVAWSRTPRGGEEGADLLMYLATSPSRATGDRAKANVQPPTTPPCKPTPLPSSHMTPGTHGNGFIGFNPATPGTNFNFADFVNVTPSPAQMPWTRTPGTVRGSSTRRRLNFDGAMASSSSPSLIRKGEGLGMELGGNLL